MLAYLIVYIAAYLIVYIATYVADIYYQSK